MILQLTFLHRVIHPTKMLCGMLAIGVAFGLFYYLTNAKRSATKFKKEHPVISVLIVLGGGYFIVYMLGSVIVFLLGILLPIMGTYVHTYVYAQQLCCLCVNRFSFLTCSVTSSIIVICCFLNFHLTY